MSSDKRYGDEMDDAEDGNENNDINAHPKLKSKAQSVIYKSNVKQRPVLRDAQSEPNNNDAPKFSIHTYSVSQAMHTEITETNSVTNSPTRSKKRSDQKKISDGHIKPRVSAIIHPAPNERDGDYQVTEMKVITPEAHSDTEEDDHHDQHHNNQNSGDRTETLNNDIEPAGGCNITCCNCILL